MPDLTMCGDLGCEKRNQCYRFTAKPDDGWQSWLVDSPRNKATGECDQFWPNQKTKRKKT